eukprot:m.1597212 g.1597212  ORF g.1597212 m.1597212 type:complete len:318 (-) comp25344_c0_seq1:4604-5557(-)
MPKPDDRIDIVCCVVRGSSAVLAGAVSGGSRRTPTATMGCTSDGTCCVHVTAGFHGEDVGMLSQNADALFPEQTRWQHQRMQHGQQFGKERIGCKRFEKRPYVSQHQRAVLDQRLVRLAGFSQQRPCRPRQVIRRSSTTCRASIRRAVGGGRGEVLCARHTRQGQSLDECILAFPRASRQPVEQRCDHPVNVLYKTPLVRGLCHSGQALCCLLLRLPRPLLQHRGGEFDDFGGVKLDTSLGAGSGVLPDLRPERFRGGLCVVHAQKRQRQDGTPHRPKNIWGPNGNATADGCAGFEICVVVTVVLRQTTNSTAVIGD